MSRELLAMALDALDDPSTFRKTFNARAALRAALAAPEPEPVAWYYVEDPWGANEWHFMTDSPESQECDPRDWTPLYAAPPAAPAPVPDGWVMAPREPTPEMRKAAADAWIDCDSKLILNKAAAAIRAAIAASPAAPAAPVVREPLTDEQIWSMWMSSEFRGNGGQADWFCEGIRAAEAQQRRTAASQEASHEHQTATRHANPGA